MMSNKNVTDEYGQNKILLFKTRVSRHKLCGDDNL